MIVDDLNVIGIAVLPAKTDSPLVIDANTVLAGTISLELLQTVPRWDAQVVKLLGGVHQAEFAQHRAVELGGETPDRLALKQALGVPVGEALDHVA